MIIIVNMVILVKIVCIMTHLNAIQKDIWTGPTKSFSLSHRFSAHTQQQFPIQWSNTHIPIQNVWNDEPNKPKDKVECVW